MISQKRLQQLLDYDPDSGVFVWKKSTSNRVKVGQIAGKKTPRGVVVQLDGERYQANRLAWLYAHGEFPTNDLCHLNGDKLDNRLSNLHHDTQTDIRNLIDYDPLIGEFRWKVDRRGGEKKGNLSGWESSGYLVITVFGKDYRAHHLAWLFCHGELPVGEVDHKNGNRSDNRIANLRLATRAENACNRGASSNNTSGWCGVHFSKAAEKYQAEIGLASKTYYLGVYDSPEIAAAVYNHVCQQIHGDFARPDLPDWLIPDAAFVKAIGGNMKQISKAIAAAAIHHAQEKEFQNDPD